MIKRLLIANRGEIACRIIRTAKALGIHTIAVYSQADSHAQHVLQADEAWFIGESAVNQSYLCSDKIITVAHATEADAVHPGYGFLSENADFARTCAEQNIIFVGPDEYALKAMGSKSQAKAIMQQAQVPLVPGYHGDEQALDYLLAEADKIGYPVILKASAGGGGKGMRIVTKAAEFSAALDAAQREALASFADTHMLVEKYIAQPRHIEVQVFCDRHGNGVYLFDRDCSVQRRHQKIVEEAPAPGLSDTLREQMGKAAVSAALAIDYVGAGTVEFLLDSNEQFYFMEMNTRLQVEHPVTEMVTNEDLVAWQLMVANNAVLPKTQAQLSCSGHAIEVRVYAENPQDNFLPATGVLQAYLPPETNANVRVDSGVVQGDEIGIYYDPMFAKLICKGRNRQEALQRCQQALQQFFIAGVTTNLGFLQVILSHPEFVKGQVSTHFIADYYADLMPKQLSPPPQAVVALAGVIQHSRNSYKTHISCAKMPQSSTLIPANWRSNLTHTESLNMHLCADAGLTFCASVTNSAELQRTNNNNILNTQHTIIHANHSYHVALERTSQSHRYMTVIDQQRTPMYACEYEPNNWSILYYGQRYDVTWVQPDFGEHSANQKYDFVAPMNGTVVHIPITPPCQIKEGETVMIIEAMKMEHNIVAPCAGKITEVFYQTGSLVSGGATVVNFVAEDDL
jgi:3-methylcrotonyl-CoA carboxylase alpha subunit